MKFDIRITFDGLYLLAVEEKKFVHALLINFGEDVPYGCDCSHGESHHGNGSHAHGGNGHGAKRESDEMPRHYPMIYFDAAHLAINGPDRERMTGHPFGVSLKDRVVRLEEIGGPIPPDVGLDPKIVPLSRISDARAIDHRALGAAPSRIIAGRVTLGCGRPRPVEQFEDFDLIRAGKKAEALQIATRVEWEIAGVEGVNIDTFPFEVRDIETDAVIRTHILRPVTVFERGKDGIEEKSVIQFHVYCAGARDLPGGAVIHPLERGAPMPHLDGFFQLFPGVRVPTLKRADMKTGSTEQCTGMQVGIK
jgi:hypothetical protein